MKIAARSIFLLLASIVSFLLLPSQGNAQANYSTARIQAQQDARFANVFTFTVSGLPDLKPFQQVGGDSAHHTLLWVFGDGTFSRENNPRHVFPASASYAVTLHLSAKYSTGGPPPAMRSTVVVPTGSFEALTKAAALRPLALETNHLLNVLPQPSYSIVADHQNVLLASYANTSQSDIPSGRLLVFFNETVRQQPDFRLDEAQTWAGEQSVPYTTAQVKSLAQTYPAGNKIGERLKAVANAYSDVLVWQTGAMPASTERLIALTFNCQPALAQSEGASLFYDVLWLPDSVATTIADNSQQIEMLVRRSHDPNRIEVSRKKAVCGTRKNSDKLLVTIHFENIGTGPATLVRLRQPFHAAFDTASMQLVACSHLEAESLTALRPKKVDGMLEWTLDKIHLPGSQEIGFNNDGTNTGYLQFEVLPRKKFRRALTQQAEIVFDSNEPIATNSVRTRLLRNHRVGARAGLLLHDLPSGSFKTENSGLNNVFVQGFSSPMRHSRFFRQHQAGLEHISYRIPALKEGGADTTWNVLRIAITPVQLATKFGPVVADVGTPIQYSLAETVDGVAAPKGSRWAVGAEAGIALHPTTRGWNARLFYRYSYTNALGHQTKHNFQLIGLGAGYAF